MATKNKTEQLALRLEAPVTEQQMALAFARWQDERSALPDDALLSLNCDVRAVVSIVARALPKVARAVPELPKVPGFGPESLEELRDLNAALMHAQILYAQREAADAAVVERRAVVDEALALLAQLEAQVEVLEKLGRIEPKPAVQGPKTRSKRATLGDDLTRAVKVLRGLDDELAAKLVLDEGAIDRAMAIQAELGHALSLGTARPRRSQSAKDTAKERARAFTLVARRYEHLGAAVACLRFEEGDVGELVPSLRARGARAVRHPRKAASDAAAAAGSETTAKAGDVPVAVGSKAPVVESPRGPVAEAAHGAGDAPAVGHDVGVAQAADASPVAVPQRA